MRSALLSHRRPAELRLGLVLGGVVDVGADVDVREGRHQIRQHERVGVVRVQEIAALLGEVGFLGALVDGEEQFFLEREEFVLAGVLMEGKLGFVERAAVHRVFQQAQQRLVARLAELGLEQQQARLPRSCRRPASAFASLTRRLHSMVCLRTSCSMPGLNLSYWWVETVAGPAMISGVRASSIRMESTSSTMAKT